MRKTRTQLAKFAAIAMLSVGAVTLSVATVGAATEFSTGELATISSTVDNAIAQAKASLPANATPEQINAAVASAISTATQSLITQFGQMSPMLVAEAVITAAHDDGASPREIGAGMADAALAETNSTTSLEIADAVGATAPAGAIRAFQETADASHSSLGQTLASAASSYENVGAGGRTGGGLGGNGTTQSFFGGTSGTSGAGGGGGGCRNPSCT